MGNHENVSKSGPRPNTRSSVPCRTARWKVSEGLTVRKLVVGIYVDFMGMLSTDSEDEYEEICDRMSMNLNGSNLTFIKLDVPMDADAHVLDILVVDYGGLSTGVGFDAASMVHDFSSYMYKYIQDHPSVAVVVFSKMTETVYGDFVADEIGRDMDQHAPNVFLFDHRRSSYCTTKLSVNQQEGEGFVSALKRFLGDPCG